MGKRGDNKSVFTYYDLKILNCLLNVKELKIGEIETKTSGTNFHIRERINKLENYGLLQEDSRGGRAIFVSLSPNSKKFVKELLNFSRGKI
jgi:hypothetical protein